MLNGIVYFIEIYYKPSRKYIHSKCKNLYFFICIYLLLYFRFIHDFIYEDNFCCAFTPFINLRMKN